MNIFLTKLFFNQLLLMNKHLLLATVLFFISFLVQAQTYVSGNINKNTTWTKAGSPYILTGDVGIPSAYTLTVEPGVSIVKNDIYQIIVIGAIQLNGTVTDSINFVNAPDITQDSKFFIQFLRSNLDNSSLQYVSFQHNGGYTSHIRAGYMEMEPSLKNTGTLLIKHSNLSNGNFFMWGYQTEASAQLDSCLLDSVMIDNYTEKINISNSQIHSSNIYGRDYSLGTYVNNCYATTSWFSGTTLINSTVERSRVGASGYNTSHNLITNSNFINSLVDVSSGSIIATDSKFTATDEFITVRSEYDYMFSADKLTMRNCQLINNSSYNINGLYIGDANYYGYENDTVLHNQFTNLYNAVTVRDFNTIQLDSNNFSIPGRYDIANYSPKDFYALHNNFQLKEGQSMDDVIYDQIDYLPYGLVITDPFVLPVTLLNFNGNKDGKTVKLNWQTSKEINTFKYIIERKVNNEFTAVGTVAAAGNSSTANNYHFTDYTPSTGTNYYRLKIVDVDGKYTYSAVVPVEFTGNISRLSIYPNPATTYVIVEHNVAYQDAQLELVDMSGRKVKTIIVPKGDTQTKLDVTRIARGTYKVVWHGGTTTESKTLLVQ
jgi:hypothetical protein